MKTMYRKATGPSLMASNRPDWPKPHYKQLVKMAVTLKTPLALGKVIRQAHFRRAFVLIISF